MSSLLLAGRSLLSLVIVVGLVVILGKFARKRSLPKGRSTAYQPLIIESKMALGKGQSLVVVRDGASRLVLGVTANSIAVVSQSEAPEVEVATIETKVDTIDLREFEDPEQELADQWGQRRLPTRIGAQGPPWMAFLSQMRGALLKR